MKVNIRSRSWKSFKEVVDQRPEVDAEEGMGSMDNDQNIDVGEKLVINIIKEDGENRKKKKMIHRGVERYQRLCRRRDVVSREWLEDITELTGQRHQRERQKMAAYIGEELCQRVVQKIRYLLSMTRGWSLM